MLGAAQSAVSGSSTEAVAKRDVLAPGAQYGANLTSQINFVSLAWRWCSAPRAFRTC
jgi:cation/acetate symporter